MSSIVIGTLLWISVQPLIRLQASFSRFLCVGCGFGVTKAGLLPAVAARGIGLVIINVTTPNLMFSTIVPSFNSSNITELGPLVLVALIYMLIGITLSWIIKQLFWVPHRFRHGILVAGGWANIGDVPISVALSVMASAPFNGTDDENLAVSYIAVFLLVWSVTLFPLGGHRCVMMDFEGPDLENDEVKERLSTKHSKILSRLAAVFLHLRQIFLFNHPPVKEIHTEVGQNSGEKETPRVTFTHEDSVTTCYRPSEQEEIGVLTLTNEHMLPPKFLDPTSPSLTSVQPGPLLTDGAEKVSTTTGPPDSITGHVTVAHAHWFHKFISLAFGFLRSLLTPPSLSIIVSFIIAIIPSLKALFVPGVPGTHIPSAPDGQPPLALIMKTATFISGASVPMGLITLGSALARLSIPLNQLSSLPLGAIGSLAVGRLVVMPVLGILICQQFTHIGLIDPSNNVLRFVCILLSGLPTATTMVFLTQVYSGTGNAEHLSAFLIPQYIIMFVSMTAITSFTLHILFG
ncbi:auxin efflux carrier [Suillus subalutaceus]|uniref:auxin efflux carrier n=1 Tax=Suillus subalutaceus TaxID=48586 RepID=UPI001B87BDB3|nr:auxin efflux carrier [Suillus subalutaceus]KAG1835398.1 auxin efflux carrier [Suillus subalutaceus]